ncbi:hypothetical protein B9G69_017255 [Bdellovibrio sp. SKB1291214]|uniref:hypothetical protein n=1 Tax=Bdellovibrio sp. SKB1291214 TaxID=1732569 RepID=UPI000B51BC82|nr:hypothetical protein [Bdellovibrio sp. SKB1291214]UYL08793.1 hypothetical protein B9G69_017255 [Bdellovibrio sp. SKB1291214]
MRLLTSLVLLFSGGVAEARLFDINKESVAPYFTLMGGPSGVGKSGYENEASNITVSGDSKYVYGGEFGAVVSTRPMNLTFGIEFLKPNSVAGFSGVDTGGTQVYSGDSDILGYAPKVGIELNLHGDNESRSFVSASLGYVSVTLKNSYTLTAAGTAAYPGVATMIESKGTATEITAGLGYEGVLSEQTTYVFQFGYRQLRFDNLKYSHDYNTFNGAVSSGDTVKNGASNRELNLSGGYLSLGFRFYM